MIIRDDDDCGDDDDDNDDGSNHFYRAIYGILFPYTFLCLSILHSFKVITTEISSLRSNQEETDTRVVMYLHHAEKLGFKSAVVRTPDSDIFFILLLHSHDLTLTVYLDTGTGKHRRLINISELANEFGKEWCAALLGFYVFTGEDCTSAFKGKGKVAPLKLLQRNPKFHKTFR